MKLEKNILANTFALATAILWVGCVLTVAILPGFSLLVTTWWMHGLNISVMGGWNLTLTGVLFGGITLVVSAWITGWVFGWSWEKANTKK